MDILQYIKVKGNTYLAWSTKKDVETAMEETNGLIGTPKDEYGNVTTVSNVLTSILEQLQDGFTIDKYRATDAELRKYYGLSEQNET